MLFDWTDLWMCIHTHTCRAYLSVSNERCFIGNEKLKNSTHLTKNLEHFLAFYFSLVCAVTHTYVATKMYEQCPWKRRQEPGRVWSVVRIEMCTWAADTSMCARLYLIVHSRQPMLIYTRTTRPWFQKCNFCSLLFSSPFLELHTMSWRKIGKRLLLQCFESNGGTNHNITLMIIIGERICEDAWSSWKTWFLLGPIQVATLLLDYSTKRKTL